jgi:hypothetical protein
MLKNTAIIIIINKKLKKAHKYAIRPTIMPIIITTYIPEPKIAIKT